MLDESGGWAWGYSSGDRYVGYVPSSALAEPDALPTHRIDVVSALLFVAPDIKSPVAALWPMGARFAATDDEGAFLRVAGCYLHERHTARLDMPEADAAGVAERLVGVPYRWGGRSGAGIDCSGLVQLALDHTGIAAPRDSDQQRAALGEALPEDAPLRRGDLVFFPGHVGIMADDARLIHANAYWMAVTIEPLADVVARLAADHPEPILCRRRLA